MARLGFDIDTGSLVQALEAMDKVPLSAGKMEQAVTSAATATSGALSRTATTVQSVVDAVVASNARLGTSLRQIETFSQRLDSVFGTGRTPFAQAAESASVFGAELDRLRAKFNPVFAAGQQYKMVVAEIRQAQLMGALSSAEATAAIERERTATQRLVEARRTAAAVSGAGGGGGAGMGGAGNANARFLGTNIMYQLQDVAVTSAMGMNAGMIGLMQGSQIGAAGVAAGGGMALLSGLKSGLLALVSPTNVVAIGLTTLAALTIQWATRGRDGVKTLDEAMKDHGKTLALLRDYYGEVAKAQGLVTSGGVAFVRSSVRSDQSVLAAQMRTMGASAIGSLHGEGWLATMSRMGRGAPDFSQLGVTQGGGLSLGRDQLPFQSAIESFLASVRQGSPDMEKFSADIDSVVSRLAPSSGDPMGLKRAGDSLLTIGGQLITTGGKFSAFSEPIAKFFLQLQEGDPDIRALTSSIEKIGEKGGPALRKTADEAILLMKDLVGVADAAREAQRSFDQARDTRARDMREASAGRADANRYVGARSLEERRARASLDAEIQSQNARTDAERLAAARASAGAQYAGSDRRRLQEELAVRREQARIEKEIADRRRDQQFTSSEAIRGAEEQLTMVGKTSGEVARLQAMYQGLAEARQYEHQTGRKMSDEQLADIKKQADALGDLADKLAKVRLADSLAFERRQLGRTDMDAQVASQLRSAGLDDNDLDSQAAKEIRINEILKQRVAVWKDLRQTGQDAIDKLFEGSLDGIDGITSALEEVATDIVKQMTQLAAANPLKNALFGTSLPTMDSVGGIGGFFRTMFGQTANPAAGAASVGAMTVTAGSVIVTGGAGVGAGGALDAINRVMGLGGSGNSGVTGSMTAYAAAIRQVESAGSGGYSALGPVLPNGNQALGAYQIMRSNLPSWSQAALGRSVSQSEFMSSPSIQDAIFQHRFGGYLDKYGNPQDAASVWFTGRPQSSGAGATDILGTTGSGYVSKFNAALTQATGRVGSLAGASGDAAGGLGQLGSGLTKFGQNLSQFPSAPSGGGGGIGGWLSSLFGGGGLSSAFSGSSAYSWLSANPGGYIGLYADGGYTGPGGKYQVAGLAHKGEFWFSQEATQNLGVDYLQALHSAAKSGRGMASGGHAGGTSLPRSGGANAPLVAVYDMREAGSPPVEQREKIGPDGQRQLEIYIRRTTQDEVSRPSAQTNRNLRGTYGLSNQVTRR